jgi:sporulation protein YabP
MPYEQAQKTAKAVHTLSLENREKLSLSGVEDVSGFDESLIVLTTAQGDLNIRGEELHIERIDLELGQLEVRGHIQDLSYDEPKAAHSLWSRLFG